jgi:hypothetical protein
MNAREKRIRIGDWLIPYDDATAEVVLERTLIDILQATPGNAQDCMNSWCIRAQRNRHAFPHPVYVVSTIASRVYIVDRLDGSGNPAHAVRYELTKRDRALINAHDRYGAGELGELRLRVPTDPKGSPRRAARNGGHGHNAVASHSLGAKARFAAAVGALSLPADGE